MESVGATIKMAHFQDQTSPEKVNLIFPIFLCAIVHEIFGDSEF